MLNDKKMGSIKLIIWAVTIGHVYLLQAKMDKTQKRLSKSVDKLINKTFIDISDVDNVVITARNGGRYIISVPVSEQKLIKRHNPNLRRKR